MTAVVVVGGGVVGLCSAYALVQAGAQVTLLEAREQVGLGCSYANGGQLSYRYVAPLADAGVPWQALGWLLQGQRSPLRFRPRLEARQWRWLWQFLRCCNRATHARNTLQMLTLALASQQQLQAWQAQLPLADCGWRSSGKLVLHRRAGQLKAAAERRIDPTQQVLEADQCLALDPSLASLLAGRSGGIFTPGEAVADCLAFCRMLETALRQAPGFRLLTHTAVTGLCREGKRVRAVRTTQGELECDQLLLANGLTASELAREAGDQLLLYPLKGYSLSLPWAAEGPRLQLSVTDLEHKVVYARLKDQLRAAAMVDIVGHDAHPEPRRIAELRRLTAEAFPALAEIEPKQVWAGLRPATPSGVPILGRGRLSNLWYNAGHGALGFTLAAGCARWLCDSLLQGSEVPECRPFGLS